MNTPIKHLFPLPVLIASLTYMLANRVAAQTLTTLHGFTPSYVDHLTNSDGSYPGGGVILSGSTLYGTAEYGGSSGNGTVFRVNSDGSGFTNLHSFAAGIGTDIPNLTNSDGAYLNAGLILSGSTLYGTAEYGGSSGKGTVFKVNTDGWGFTTLHSFTGFPDDGADSHAGLILSGNTLYGTTRLGGSFNDGTVFAVKTDGTGYTNIHSFTAPGYGFVNSDGALPYAGLILSGNTLYGTASQGGSSGNGTVFKVNTDGSGFTTVHSFTAFSGAPYDFTNSDGAQPWAGLIISGNTLYGTAQKGGIPAGAGTVFKVNTDGSGFTNLHSFIGFPEGNSPRDGLILSGNTLYGTTVFGGLFGSGSGNGTVFAVNIDGSGFKNLYSFAGGSDGIFPHGVVLSGNTLYGTSVGSYGAGAVYGLSLLPPQLTMIRSITNVVLAWPTYAPGVTLQSTTNLAPPAVWSTVSPTPVIVNGQNAVTNPVAGKQIFYRLSQ